MAAAHTSPQPPQKVAAERSPPRASPRGPLRRVSTPEDARTPCTPSRALSFRQDGTGANLISPPEKTCSVPGVPRWFAGKEPRVSSVAAGAVTNEQPAGSFPRTRALMCTDHPPPLPPQLSRPQRQYFPSLRPSLLKSPFNFETGHCRRRSGGGGQFLFGSDFSSYVYRRRQRALCRPVARCARLIDGAGKESTFVFRFASFAQVRCLPGVGFFDAPLFHFAFSL